MGYKLSDEQNDNYRARIMRAMLPVIAMLPVDDEDFTLKQEVNLLAEVWETGVSEARAINNELREEYGEDRPYFHYELQQALASCLLAKILHGDEVSATTDVPMFTHGGSHILRFAVALRAFEAASFIEVIEDEEDAIGCMSPDFYLKLQKQA